MNETLYSEKTRQVSYHPFLLIWGLQFQAPGHLFQFWDQAVNTICYRRLSSEGSAARPCQKCLLNSAHQATSVRPANTEEIIPNCWDFSSRVQASAALRLSFNLNDGDIAANSRVPRERVRSLVITGNIIVLSTVRLRIRQKSLAAALTTRLARHA